MKGCDVVIIGAGVTGLATALALQKRGATVRVLEKNTASSEASWAGGGILCPLYAWRYPDAVLTLAERGMQQYPGFLDRLDTEIDPQYHRCGMRIADPTDANFPTADSIQARLNHFGIQNQMHNGQLWLPEVANVRNPRLLKALTEAALRTGVQIDFQHEVVSLDIHQNKLHAVQVRHHHATEQIPTTSCVICSGAWSGRLIPNLAENVIFPVRGQMLRVQPATPLKHIAMNQGVYAIPRQDGSVVIGSTVEYAGFNKKTDTDTQNRLLRTAAATSPELANAKITHRWAGLRPGTQDEHPIIGPHPDVAGLWVNTGGFRNGLVMAPAVAELLAALMNHEPPHTETAPYQVHRMLSA